jgi:hypothetical protein
MTPDGDTHQSADGDTHRAALTGADGEGADGDTHQRADGRRRG